MKQLQGKSISTRVEFTEAAPQLKGQEGRQPVRTREYWRGAELRIEQHEIAEAAWQLWDQEGRPPGRAREYWRRAEQQRVAGQAAGR